MNNPPPLPPNQPQPYIAPEGSFDDGAKSKAWPGCLIGCLVTLGICTFLCAGVGFYAYSNFADWMITGARATTQALLEDSDLPKEERDAILEQFDRVATAYQEGELTLDELKQSMEDLAESPIIGLVMLKAIETKYLNSSGLSEEEKAEGSQTLMRVVRAAREQKLDKDEIDQLSRHVLTDADMNNPQAEQELKTTMTDEELRAFFAEAKEMVDAKEIPDEPEDFQISDIVREVVDKALAE